MMKKISFYKEKLNACKDSKLLFNTVDNLLNPKSKSVLPIHDCGKVLADNFNSFFREKVSKIYEKLSKLVRETADCLETKTYTYISVSSKQGGTTVWEITRWHLSIYFKFACFCPGKFRLNSELKQISKHILWLWSDK